MNTTVAAVDVNTVQDYDSNGNETIETHYGPEAIIVPVFFGICIIIGSVGNSLVIAIMIKIKNFNGHRLTNTNIFILNLAVADLLFLVFCVPFHATVYTLPSWPFGEFWCYFAKFCEETSKIASVFSLVALSFDRFFAVVYGTSNKVCWRTRKNAIRGLIFIWIAAVGFAIPTLFTRQLRKWDGMWLCSVANLPLYNSYQITLGFFGYVLPLILIIGCYVGLLYHIYKSTGKSAVFVSSNSMRKSVTRIVILVIAVFMLCWLPHYIVVLWMIFGYEEFYKLSGGLPFRITAHCLSYANACMNPIIYAFVSRKFRQDFKKAMKCQRITDTEGNDTCLFKKACSPIPSKNNGARTQPEKQVMVVSADDAVDSPDAARTETELMTEEHVFTKADVQ